MEEVVVGRAIGKKRQKTLFAEGMEDASGYMTNGMYGKGLASSYGDILVRVC